MTDVVQFFRSLLDLMFGNLLCLMTTVILGIVFIFVVVIVFIRRIMKREIWLR